MSTIINELLSDISLPAMYRVRQKFQRISIERAKLKEVISKILHEPRLRDCIQPGMRIALTAGSREICNIDEIIRCVVLVLKEFGADPFIVPAMGSHGGATAEGQLAVLTGYNITAEFCGCPILSSMETVSVGQTDDGRQVYMDRNAYEADGILVIGRVKAHTDFRGPFESGIMKMMAIGLGKQKGADSCHAQGFGKMSENVQKFGHMVRVNSPVIGAIAIVENAFDQTAKLIGLSSDEIEEREPEILKEAKALMPRIFVPECDVLIVEEIGKNYSGTGMDPNISGRHATPFSSGGIRSQQLAVLRLSEKTHNNGFGIGLADVTTKRAVAQLDADTMVINSLTSRVFNLCRVPYAFDNDDLAIRACVKTCVNLGAGGPRIIRISNTLKLEEIWMSENYFDEISRNENLEIISGPELWNFNQDGFLE